MTKSGVHHSPSEESGDSYTLSGMQDNRDSFLTSVAIGGTGA